MINSISLQGNEIKTAMRYCYTFAIPSTGEDVRHLKLIGMQNGITIQENNLVVPYKIKIYYMIQETFTIYITIFT